MDQDSIFTDRNIDRCFDFFDTDRSGMISIQEFTDIFKLNDQQKFEEELKNIDLFQNETHEINKYEFRKLIRKFLRH